jgi:hypothetical protein
VIDRSNADGRSAIRTFSASCTVSPSRSEDAAASSATTCLFAVGLNPSPMIAGATRGRATVRIERTVTPTSGRVAAQLARNRRRCPTQPVRDLSDAQAACRRSAISIRSSCDKNLELIERTASRSSAGTNPTT